MSAPNIPSTDRAAPEFIGGRRWTGYVAIGVVVLIAALGVVLVIQKATGGKSHATSQNNPPVSGSAAPGQGDQKVPTAAPATSWSLFRGVALPSSASAGPARVDSTGTIATGYAHTPIGALMAAANSGWRYFLAYDKEYKAAADAQLAPGAGKAAWLKGRGTASVNTPEEPGRLGQIAAFEFVSYNLQAAATQIVLRYGDGTMGVLIRKVAWLDSDWKIVPADDGGISTNAQPVTSLAGFIPWAGI